MSNFLSDLFGFLLSFFLVDLTSFGVLAMRGRPCPGLFVTSPVSLNRFIVLQASVLLTFSGFRTSAGDLPALCNYTMAILSLIF